MRPIAILYENEAWMAPLFGALDGLGAPYERVFLNELSFDPAGPAPQWSLAGHLLYLSAWASAGWFLALGRFRRRLVV